MSKEVGNSNMEAFPMSEELRKLCQINPWLPCADRFYNRPDDGMYVVDSDKPVLEKLRQKQNVLYSKFHFDILPDPLVGNVCASVIVVCLNPGYGSLDKYNYESVDEETKELVRQEYIDSLNELNNRRKRKGKKPFSREIRFIYSGEDEKKQLNFRRKRMVESLKLIPGNRPYALDNSFNSAEIINLKTNNRDGWANSRFGTYNWHRFFMGK